MAAFNTIAIVGTGPSVKGQKIKGDLIIAVNGAIKICNPDVWFTLDYSPDNQEIVENRLSGVSYVCALPDRYKLPNYVFRMKRIEDISPRPLSLLKKNQANYWLWRWSAKLGLSEDPNAINTGNSAYGALGLAYHYRPNKIILYGIDGTAEERVTGGYPNNLSHLPILFSSAKPQLKKANIKVYNKSPSSKINCFMRCDSEYQKFI